MNPTLLTLLTGIAATGSATVGGVFYAFSTFVMPGLRALPPAEGAAAMQKINVAAVRPGLMIALFGTAAVCVAVGVGAATAGPAAARSRCWPDRRSTWSARSA